MPKKKAAPKRLTKAALARRIVKIEKKRRTGQQFAKFITIPASFITEALGKKPVAYQKKVAQACVVKPKKDGSLEGIIRISVKSCHGAGKTWIAAMIVLWFLNTFKESKVFTTAPTFRQINRFLWPEIRSKFKKAKIPLMGEMYDTPLYKIAEDWFAMGMSSDKPENIEGGHAPHILYVVDEAKGVPDKIFDAIQGGLTTKHAVILLISTPGASRGHFYKSFSQKKLGYKNITITAKDALKAGMITKQWIEDMKELWGEDSYLYRTRVLSQFVVEDDTTFFPSDALFKAFENYGELNNLNYKAVEELITGKVALGVDCARFGTDYSVITALAEINHPDINAIQIEKEMIAKSSLMVLVGKIIHAMNATGAQVIAIDDTGLGGGVTDRLVELGYGDIVVPVQFGAKSIDEAYIENAEQVGVKDAKPRFNNMRTEMYWLLRENMNRLALMPDDAGRDESTFLESQCAEVTKTFTSTDKIKSVKKDGKRYDVLDSVALALHGLHSALHEAEPTDKLWEQGKNEDEGHDGVGGLGGMDF